MTDILLDHSTVRKVGSSGDLKIFGISPEGADTPLKKFVVLTIRVTIILLMIGLLTLV